ncbi:MAG: biopolymer transporter ExbD [Bdellovibrionales bacterium]|nr:biopolymer transporter ExbD [Bdellovibrionales bacterium]
MSGVRIKKKDPATPHLGLTSLMDVLTILLIFLLVNYSDQFDDIPNFVSLPLAQTALGTIKESTTGTTITVAQDRIVIGRTTLRTLPWRPADLLAAMGAALGDVTPETHLFLIADENVPYRVVDLAVVAAAQKGVYKVNFLAQSGK